MIQFIHFKKILSYSWKFNTKNVMYWKKLYVVLVTYYKKIHPKSRFYEKVKMTTKRIVILESFIIIGSFDCDCTLLKDPKYHKHECIILQCCCICCTLLRWVLTSTYLLLRLERHFGHGFCHAEKMEELYVFFQTWSSNNTSLFMLMQ